MAERLHITEPPPNCCRCGKPFEKGHAVQISTEERRHHHTDCSDPKLRDVIGRGGAT